MTHGTTGEPLFGGFDVSTQSAKLVVIDPVAAGARRGTAGRLAGAALLCVALAGAAGARTLPCLDPGLPFERRVADLTGPMAQIAPGTGHEVPMAARATATSRGLRASRGRPR